MLCGGVTYWVQLIGSGHQTVWLQTTLVAGFCLPGYRGAPCCQDRHVIRSIKKAVCLLKHMPLAMGSASPITVTVWHVLEKLL